MPDTLRIDPRDFIMGPFLTCPRCGALGFGVLSVRDTRCERRCRDCLFASTVRLPELTKKVVYIDQFAISNIMKILSPETKGHERALSEPLWNELFELLSVVCGLQLVVCPDSREHEDESLTSPFREALKSTYEHFAGGVTFYDSEAIKQLQVTRIARCWARKEPMEFDFDPQSVTHGSVHGWGDRIRVTVDGVLPGMVEHLRAARAKVHSGLENVFKWWQQERKSFKEVFESEKRSYCDTLLAGFREDCERRARMPALVMQGKMPSLDEIMPSASECMILALESVFRSEVGPDKLSAVMPEFFRSGAINEAPFVTIMAAMFASMAMKAAAGQKEPPNRGAFTDIHIVSSLLPYCDAMFLDNKCRALLLDIPREYKLPYACAVFSPNTGDQFVQYLQQIRDSASPGHLKLIEEVYGREPLKPYAGIYGVGKFRKPAEA